MLPRYRRLKSPALFKRALNGSTSHRVCSNAYFAMYGLARFPNPTAPEAIEAGHATRIHPPTQFGLIVSKKIDKRATRRNRIKRQLREAIRHYLDSPESACMQRHYRAIIIIARADLLQASFQAIRNRLETCLRHHA